MVKRLRESRANETRPFRVLIVDDDPSLTSMLTMHLRDAGFRVVSVDNCRDTLRLMKSETFDVALVDYQLPDGSGFDVVTLLRQAFPAAQLIMMSGCEESSLQERILGMNVYGFLRKPFSCGELDALVQ